MPNPEANENNNTQRTLAGAGIGAAVSAGAAVGATAAYVSAPVAAVAAPAVGAGAAAAAAAGAGTAAGAAVWGAAAAIPSLVGFGSGGIAAGSWGAWLMSTSAIANGGGVAAGGLVATGQSIGAVGLAAVTGPAIVATGAVVGAVGAGYVLLKCTAGAAAATSIWMSPAVLAGVRVIAGATAGAGVGWILCWLVGEAIRYRTFDDKDDARKAFDESPASNKVLIDPEEMVVESSDITIYSEEKKWILHELCAEAGDPDGKIRLRFFDGKDDARKAFDDSSASNKVLLNFAENVLLQFPAMPSSE